MNERVKIVVTVPESDAEKVRAAIGEAGGGKIGNYTFCSTTVSSVGRFKPEVGAKPAIGEVGKLEEIVEDRIEITCEKSALKAVVAAIRAVHPYEEPTIDVYPLIGAADDY